ncbi:immunity protein Imm33 domain-containing protein [Dyadobacter luticola]|uniref:Imm33-like domain-containing protein n=1 Tax=Dyadobacter luticola TaxID=1979387 RepID=A0A5R9L6N2_9BACT|nr:hypothetical protein [Dyadobacter luticola]TLV03895.1 hypothetical protein FEN17_09990 [Dyadobacter luticola]
MNWNLQQQRQKAFCEAMSSEFYAVAPDQKVGISRNILEAALPIYGLRIAPEGDSNGWYIWAGRELSLFEDFFLPLHVKHLDDWSPDVVKFLALAPGWRFIKAGDYENVWFDENLLPPGNVADQA